MLSFCSLGASVAFCSVFRLSSKFSLSALSEFVKVSSSLLGEFWAFGELSSSSIAFKSASCPLTMSCVLCCIGISSSKTGLMSSGSMKSLFFCPKNFAFSGKSSKFIVFSCFSSTLKAGSWGKGSFSCSAVWLANSAFCAVSGAFSSVSSAFCVVSGVFSLENSAFCVVSSEFSLANSAFSCVASSSFGVSCAVSCSACGFSAFCVLSSVSCAISSAFSAPCAPSSKFITLLALCGSLSGAFASFSNALMSLI